jgi:hypothetical protein
VRVCACPLRVDADRAKGWPYSFRLLALVDRHVYAEVDKLDFSLQSMNIEKDGTFRVYNEPVQSICVTVRMMHKVHTFFFVFSCSFGFMLGTWSLCIWDVALDMLFAAFVLRKQIELSDA